MNYVGVDLHKHFSQIAVLSRDGKVLQHKLANDLPLIRRFFRHLEPAQVAIEATGTWWWLTDLLEELGHQPVLSHPKATKAIAWARLKNDRVDAERLALLLEADLLPTVWIPPQQVREARELLRQRIHLSQMRTGVKNRIQFLLNRRNLKPGASRNWLTQRGREALAILPLDPLPRHVLDEDLELLTQLEDRIARSDAELAARFGDDPPVRRLQTIPGIGPFIAIALVVEIGEVHRFGKARQLASYMGLTGRVRASGGRIHDGRISKEGNRNLRWLMVLAATQSARVAGPLKTWYMNLRQRKGVKQARVALARKLVGVVYHVWKEEIDYLEFQRRDRRRGRARTVHGPTGEVRWGNRPRD